ncbi:serine/threonine-protein kinase [Lachnoclostridium phytofermentans]|uniref:serine/threonine-protein kinase n=1 Tax=Lachnoclostridium phytofermentans TaxID=66219 RepID=UPI0004961CC4|nr:serine/threonine-protein kinase [Lachnoclostridium phytofermentans]
MPLPFDPPLQENELYDAFPNLTSIKIIKSGGEGTVFKAYNNLLDLDVAIKVYSSDHMQKRTELEIKKLSQIDNPHLIKCISYGDVLVRGKNCYYTETPFIIGKDLNHIYETKQTLNYSETTTLILDISSAISSLWKQRVVHCDIKPDNILNNNSSYVLIDLGVAKHLDSATLTAYGVIMGTRGYFAPEQLKGRKNLTLRADFYSLGIVAYQMLVGYHPYNFNQNAMFTQPLPPFPPNIATTHALKNTIIQMTSLNPIDRPMNYEEICRLLKGE